MSSRRAPSSTLFPYTTLFRSGFDQQDVVELFDRRPDRGADLGVLVDREHDGEIRVLAGQLGDGFSDVLHRRSEVLAPMGRDQQDPAGSLGRCPLPKLARKYPALTEIGRATSELQS